MINFFEKVTFFEIDLVFSYSLTFFSVFATIYQLIGVFYNNNKQQSNDSSNSSNANNTIQDVALKASETCNPLPNIN
jgi:hypothetical protein